MYAPPEAYNELIRAYKDTLGSREHAVLLVNVELTLHLAMELGLSMEPLAVGWVLLSRMPISHEALNRLSSEQRRMWANAAQLVPLNSRSSWTRSLIRYAAEISKEHRLYDFSADTAFDQELIEFCHKNPSLDPRREAQYHRILSAVLPFATRTRRVAAFGQTYRVLIKTPDGNRSGHVKIGKPSNNKPSPKSAWFTERQPRPPIQLTLRDLLPTASFLDEREQQIGGRVHWVHDLRQIRFRRAVIHGDKLALDTEETADMQQASGLWIDGMTHLPGMVSAGKTTLAKLIIAHCLRCTYFEEVGAQYPDLRDMRITFVVGDSQTAITTAHQINTWFHDDPNGDAVSAVPIMGNSQRALHWKRLTVSQEYRKAIDTGEPHWGERWLMPVCMIESQIKWEGGKRPEIELGSEPCEGFFTKQTGKKRGERCICPLTAVCPAKQLYRDMPNAKVWITTPGALSQASLPLYWDARIAKLGELVYEQSDLVILDEVETIADWCDKTYARTEPLTNGKNGLLDKLDLQVAQFWVGNRSTLSPERRRWMLAVREAIKSLTAVLSAIAAKDQQRVTKTWVKIGAFTDTQLASRFARRLAGLKEWADVPTHLEQVQHAYAPFDELLNSRVDLLRRGTESGDAVSGLAAIMQAMNNLADDVADEAIFKQCRSWILQHHPDIEARLAALKHELEQSDKEWDRKYLDEQFDRSVDELARRLRFLLLVALLSRHVRIVIEEWYNKPETIMISEPFGQIPRAMRTVLPLPLTGRQYGFVIDTAKPAAGEDTGSRLSLFSYSNIGRSYLLNFHRLLSDFDGKPGPHVLALSGTSYLPHSTAFHVDIPPAGVLMPAQRIETALALSEFIWRPFYEKKRNEPKPIFISGERKKLERLRALVNAMLQDKGLRGGLIAHILETIETKAKHPEHGYLWEDRARVLILTNSYIQAHEVAMTLRNGWREADNAIYELKRGYQEDYEIELQPNVPRSDIEQFAFTNGRVLVAPMQSIGRGFNILNTLPEPTAAFGAVLFLTRPMNPPHDKDGTAQELNRYSLQWATDPTFPAWGYDTVYRRAVKARESAEFARRLIESRKGYTTLSDEYDLRMYPRHDLAATSAGRVIQAVGRLLRGGVPFLAYFIDAKWSPEAAKTGDVRGVESQETSLLTAMINVLGEYASDGEIGEALYSEIAPILYATINRDSN